ncbi:TorF family putative porin [Pseudoduganella dura]|uniref:TorF family putative porin n=1 Tax=Pseudoduganella dura TaxID=321982 RepID=UPI00156557EC|nr:TorF family putative porin [Pseudoduganella dura]GGX89347.1 hypothetical protein GCM10007386_20240 [Pseudoduganella dura]
MPLACSLAFFFYPATAFAQWSGSITAASEYRYRGTDFSDGKPSLQAGVAYDAGSGWYAGGFGASTRLADRGGTQLLAYGGYARRLANGLAWDAGISTVQVTQDEYGSYQELYAGLSRGGANGGVSARMSWSPRYAGGEARTLYCELDASTALSGKVDAFFHAGTLRTLSGPRPPQRADLRAGVAARFGAFGLQVAYVRNNHRPAYRYAPAPSPHAVIVSVSQGF